MELLYWPLLGALIGVAAAQRRGFSMVGGAIGGMLLGPLAILLFFVSGIASANERRKCPFCAEWIQSAATVCKHCGRDLPLSPAPAPSSGSSGGLLLAAIGLGTVVVLAALYALI